MTCYASFQAFLFGNGVTIKTLILLRKKLYVPSFVLQESLFEKGAWLISHQINNLLSIRPYVGHSYINCKVKLHFCPNGEIEIAMTFNKIEV